MNDCCSNNENKEINEQGFLDWISENKDGIKFRENFIKNLKILVLIFVLINVMVFANIWTQQCLSKVNVKAKLYMSTAAMINTMYIYPVYKIFGWGNELGDTIVLPFCAIRNHLYNQGLKNIPENDGEREIWWFVIRFSEYDKFVVDTSYKMLNEHFPFSSRIDNQIKRFNNEVYEHIVKLATLNIQDDNLRTRRYNMLVIALNRYHSGNTCSWLNLKETDTFYNNKKLMEVYKTLINLFILQTEYIKSNEPDAYDYFKNDTYNYYLDDFVLYQYSLTLVTRDLIQNKLYCNNTYLNIMGDSKARLRPYLEDSKLNANEKQRINMVSRGVGSTQKEIAKMCPTNPHLRLLREDVKYFSRPEDDKSVTRIKI